MTPGPEAHSSALGELLDYTRQRSLEYLGLLPERRVAAMVSSEELRRLVGSRLPGTGESPAAVIRALADVAEKGTVASTGPRYFGFVTGGNLPAAHAADWLVSTWDQNPAVFVLSPLVAVIEEIAAGWLREIAGLPAGMSVGFVTGCQMASFTGLAAARHRVLQDTGWNVEADGLFGAPPIDVIIGEEAHYTIVMALRLLG